MQKNIKRGRPYPEFTFIDSNGDIYSYETMKQAAKGGAANSVERMSKAVRKVLTEDAKQMSKGKEAYEEARQKDFERKIAEDYKNPRKMTFTEMVNRYL